MSEPDRIRTGVRKYRKKPIVVEAIQLSWATWSDVCDFLEVGQEDEGRPHGFHPDGHPDRIGLRIPTLEGVMTAVEGDWIIRGVAGEFYPCKPDIFTRLYELCEREICEQPV